MASTAGRLFEARTNPLLESGFWNYLREDITFSLFEQCPLKIDLETVQPILEYRSDHDYLNAITLILGRIINATFREIIESQWIDSFNALRGWFEGCPKRLQPFSRHQEATRPDLSFPETWFLQPCHGKFLHNDL